MEITRIRPRAVIVVNKRREVEGFLAGLKGSGFLPGRQGDGSSVMSP